MVAVNVPSVSSLPVLVCSAIANATDWVASMMDTDFSHSPGGWTSKFKVLAGLVSGEGSLSGLQMGVFLLCPHVALL